MNTKIHVFCGTRGEYVKLGPVLRHLAVRDVPHRLVDSGQHGRTMAAMRATLGLREPDRRLGGAEDVDTIPQALRWALRLAAGVRSRRHLREAVFGGQGGLCVVHGDTASTLVGTLLACWAGLDVAHVESGLRSFSYGNPFPEEAIRVLVARRARLVFPPDPAATENLRRMGVRGRIVQTSANTIAEVLHDTLGDDLPEAGSGPVLAQLHRQENLRSRERLLAFVELLCRVAADHPVRFVLHGATRKVFARRGLIGHLERAGVVPSPPVPVHRDFLAALYAARFVVTDGATVQEECAALGVPTLLWRARTERDDGLGSCVVLAAYDPAVVEEFLADPDRRRDPTRLRSRPSAEIVTALVAELR